MSKIVVDQIDNWYRDSDSGSLQCADTKQYRDYMAAQAVSKRKNDEFETLQKEVSELKSDMSDIKSLLLTLVQSKQRKHYDD